MFGDQKHPKTLWKTDRLFRISSAFPLYVMFTTSLFFEKQLYCEDGRKNEEKENCSNFIDFFSNLLFSHKICKKMEMTMNVAGCSLKSPSLPPVRANSRRFKCVLLFHQSSQLGGVRISISWRTLRCRLLRVKVRK